MKMERVALERLLAEGLSIDAIAERVDRSPSTVWYWLKRYGLQANGAAKYGPKTALAREELTTLVGEGLSVPEISERLGRPPSFVRYWLERYELHTRQSENRARARAALARGERFAELSCVHHGAVRHVLESRGSYRCVRCRADQVAEHRRKIKRLLVAEAGGCCRLCGYRRCEAALEFHHLDPSKKSFHLSLRGITRSIEKVREEAQKCMLLCANCHAEVEAGYSAV